MNYIDKLKNILKNEGLRYTKQRQQVWDEIRSSSEHRDAEEIYIQINNSSNSIHSGKKVSSNKKNAKIVSCVLML